MKTISAQTNEYADNKKTHRDKAETDRNLDGNVRITSGTGRGYEETMRTYHEYAEEACIRERDRDRDRDHKRYQK
jgi:hypothetical protein